MPLKWKACTSVLVWEVFLPHAIVGAGPGKFIPHHTNSAMDKALIMEATMFLTVRLLLHVFIGGGDWVFVVLSDG